MATNQTYDVPAMIARACGWQRHGVPMTADEARSECDGYFVDQYFDREGRYLGPDEDGIEPIFAPATVTE